MNICAIMSMGPPAIAEEPKTIAVRAILEAKGWDVAAEIEHKWSGFMAKVRWAKTCAEELTQFTHLLLMDARDVVVLDPPEVILERFLEFDHPWVFNAEPHIWPQGMCEPGEYPPCEGPYRYLNSGAFIAERTHLLDCLSRWSPHGNRLTHIIAMGEDGPFYTNYYLDEPGAIELDHGCELFQCMCGSDWLCTVTPGDVHNVKMDSHPRIIHFNGGTDITQPDRRELWQHLLMTT